MQFRDLIKLFGHIFTPDPLSQRADPKALPAAGHGQPDVIPDLRNQDGAVGAAGFIRVQQELVDTTVTTSRLNRYKEYDRLVASIPEIDMALTVLADETCVAGSTLIQTMSHGLQPIRWLAENMQGDFAVYCYDFERGDFTIGWAYDPRLVKHAPVVKLLLDDGSTETVTPDHRVLRRDGTWALAGTLKAGDTLMPFHRKKAPGQLKNRQYPRIFSMNKGWVHERQFLDEWRTNRRLPEYERLNQVTGMVAGGLTTRQIAKTLDVCDDTVKFTLKREGFTIREVKNMGRRPNYRTVIGVVPYDPMPVYDLSVRQHENFCTENLVMHNCQKADDGRVFKVVCENKEIKEELEFLYFNRGMLNLDHQKMWDKTKRLYIKGDLFEEIIINPDNPKEGIYQMQDRPAETMYRIETTKQKLLEFQQSSEGPDYQSVAKGPVQDLTDQELAQATAIRFAPEQIVHIRLGDSRRSFYPYGVSLIEAARGPAHQLRLMEDAMMVTRLVRAPERKVFYVDVGQLPSARAEAYMDRIKDQFRKKKVVNNRATSGPGAVEERYHAPAMDEDIWLPIRPNSNTRIDTLPGACLALDTRIPLLDGRVLELTDIIAEHKAGKELWTYSCCPKTGKTAPGLITWAGVTRKAAQVVKVTFDNGKSVTCTPDHNFPVQGKGKTEAKDLKPGDSMFPFHTRKELLRADSKWDYTQVFDTATQEWEFVHRMVAKAVRDTQYAQEMVFLEENADKPKTIVHHKNFDRYDNCPSNLAMMDRKDHTLYHSAFASKRMKQRWMESSVGERTEWLGQLKAMNETLCQKLATEPSFRQEFIKKQLKGWEKSRRNNPELHEARGKKITAKNLAYWSNPENKKTVFAKQTVNYPKPIYDALEKFVADGKSLLEALAVINSDPAFIQMFVAANAHIARDIDLTVGLDKHHAAKMVKQYAGCGLRDLRKKTGGKAKFLAEHKMGRPAKEWPRIVLNKFMTMLGEDHDTNTILAAISTDTECQEALRTAGRPTQLKHGLMNKMLRAAGYTGLKDAKAKAPLYNHKVVSVEFLPDTQDTGTITIDGKHTLHDYHTFAIHDIVYTYNSSLGEIDDCVYFRNKLFVAMNFPKNYFSQEDPSATRVTLSSQDYKFARMIERLQGSIEQMLYEVGDRHLRMRGYPPEMYDDLQLKMTPPSDWREMSRAEVWNNRITMAGAVKSMGIMADFDILVRYVQLTEDEAKEVIARNKIQKLEDLKLQVLAQNPQLLGVGIPGQNEPEMGTEPGGPGQLPGLDQGQPPGMPPPGGQLPGGPPPAPQGPPMPPPPKEDMLPPAGQAKPLPDPSVGDLLKYDMDIEDYDADQDVSEPDWSEGE